MLVIPNLCFQKELLITTIITNCCRWHNHLNPDIKKDAWTLDEEMALMNAHQIHGNKWAEIAKVLPGRYSLHILFNISLLEMGMLTAI